MTRMERELGEWFDSKKPTLSVFYGNTGLRLASNAATVRATIARLGIDATARADSASKSVIVERR